MDTIRAYLDRNIGCFEVAGGEAEQIVHLQRYDDFADWRGRVHRTSACPAARTTTALPENG